VTSRERITAAFDRRAADRIPFGELVIDTRCAEAILERKTPVHSEPLWLDGLADGSWEELVAREAQDRIDLALAAGLDWISVDQNYPAAFRPERMGVNQWRCGGNVVTYDPETGITYNSAAAQPADLDRYAEELLRAQPPAGIDGSTFAVIRRIRMRQAELGLDLPLVMRNYLMSAQQHLELLACYPESALAYFRLMTDHAVRIGTQAIAEGVAILGAGGHVGGKGTSLLSDAHYRRFILPGIREQIASWHAQGARAYIASGGCIWPIADAFLLESGAEAYVGLDTFAGMDIDRLWTDYGHAVCLIGGVDSVETLCHGTPADVRDETRAVLDRFGDRSGFMLASSNSIHHGVPPENFIAMVTAYREYYRL